MLAGERPVSYRAGCGDTLEQGCHHGPFGVIIFSLPGPGTGLMLLGSPLKAQWVGPYALEGPVRWLRLVLGRAEQLGQGG
jgi:hypothetical protein